MTQLYVIHEWYKIKYPELESEYIFITQPNEKVMLKDYLKTPQVLPWFWMSKEKKNIN